jgi:hypothetical protein
MAVCFAFLIGAVTENVAGLDSACGFACGAFVHPAAMLNKARINSLCILFDIAIDLQAFYWLSVPQDSLKVHKPVRKDVVPF